MPIELATFLQPAVQPVFDKLFSMGEQLLLSKLTGAEVADTVKRWKVQLQIFGPLLVDAEQKKSSDEAVKTWLRNLQDLAYDMEDMLEHFAIQDHEKELETASDEDIGIIDTITNMFSSFLLNPINPIDLSVQSQIDDINGRLESLQSRIQNLSLSVTDFKQQQTISIQTEALREQRESVSMSEQEIFGRDSKKQEIMALLLKDDDQSNKKNYAVIPIVGKGGVGKTTLAQYVYNDEQLKDRFDLKAWVCVSDVFDVKRITTSIFNQAATGQNVNFSDLNEAQEKLEEQLKDKRFFIVLDDIWNDNYDLWVKLRTPFRNAAKGSRVIITTRIEKIARMMIDESINTTIINLQGLQDDECWCLFQQHICVDSDLSEMRDNIIKKCKGLPLAVKTLGGLLKKTLDKEDRKRIILQSDTWSEQNNVLLVLKLSYDYLPSHLKRVFAYCSLFPKDYVFTEMEVVLLWMAQGFLPENQTQRMEDIGHNYFCELVSRSLFEASPSSEEEFIMHDLIHDLALWAADDICYVISTADKPHRALNRIRHVFLTEDATKLGNQLPKASQWRTFYCPCNNESIEDLDLIPRFRFMRTLYLYSNKMNVLPKCIGDLKHLRFLVLIFERLEELPKSINSLWNLQTLGLECSSLQHVPNIGFWEKLRHLYINTTSLREMPMGIGKLTNLQKLNEFFLRDGSGERVRDLKNLNHLHRKLKISGLQSVLSVEDAKEAQLDKKDCLDKLCLEWSCERDATVDISKEYVLEQLKPHNLIKRLKLFRYRGKRFPTWLGNPCFSKMVDIRLKKCEKCEYLPPLGQLPSLKILSIEDMGGIKEIGAEFHGDSRCQNPSFPVLESLKFKNMESWEKWVHSPSHDRAFLHLKELSIEYCPSLEGELPPHLPSLTKLKIQDCGELISFSLQSVPFLEVLESRRCNVIFNDGGGWCFDVEDQCVNIPCELPHLTTLKIEECKSPKSLPEGLLLPALQYLEFEDCENMESLPSQLHKYTSLKTLTISECPKIEEIPEGGLPINLQELTIEEVNIKQRVQELGVHHLHSLRSLDLTNVGMTPEDLSLPSSLSELAIWGSQNLKTISSCTTLPNLTTLRVYDCPVFQSLIGMFNSLSRLTIEDCPMFESLVANLGSLSYLEIRNCPNFEFSAEGGLTRNLTHLTLWGRMSRDKPIRDWGLHLLSSLESLTIVDLERSTTEAVECIPSPNLLLPSSSLSHLTINGFQDLKSIDCSSFPNLNILWIKNCPKFESFGDHGPPKLQHINSLSRLTIVNCPMFESLVANLGSLSYLEIRNCPNFEFSAEGGLPRNLTRLTLWGRMNRDKPIREWGLHLLSSLEYLDLYNLGRSTTEAVECIPSPNLLLPSSSLSYLTINGVQDLKSIDGSSFPNLTRLWISNCPKFESFGDHGLPPKLQHINSLSRLTIENCPMFESLVANLGSLSDLKIRNCPNFEFSAEGGLPRNLTHLTLWGRMNRDKPIREWGLHLLSSLKSLTIGELGRSTTEAVECIPSPNLLLPSSSLSELFINGFQDLKSIDVSSFPNLIYLRIKNCPKFESFGDHGLPPKLQRMKIEECESLKPHLKIDPGGPIYMDNCKYSLL